VLGLVPEGNAALDHPAHNGGELSLRHAERDVVRGDRDGLDEQQVGRPQAEVDHVAIGAVGVWRPEAQNVGQEASRRFGASGRHGDVVDLHLGTSGLAIRSAT